MSNYLQKPFDKAFVKVIEDLVNTRAIHGKFTKRKQLIAEFDILDTNYVSIRSGERGVPSDKYDKICRYLKDNFFVNPDFLYGRSSVMYLRNPRSLSGSSQTESSNNVASEQDYLSAEVMNLKSLLQEKERFILFQQQTIEMLSKQIEKLQDFMAGKSNTNNGS